MFGVNVVCRPPSKVLSATSVNCFAVAKFNEGSVMRLFEESSVESSILVSCWLLKVIDASGVGRWTLL